MDFFSHICATRAIENGMQPKVLQICRAMPALLYYFSYIGKLLILESIWDLQKYDLRN